VSTTKVDLGSNSTGNGSPTNNTVLEHWVAEQVDQSVSTQKTLPETWTASAGTIPPRKLSFDFANTKHGFPGMKLLRTTLVSDGSITVNDNSTDDSTSSGQTRLLRQEKDSNTVKIETPRVGDHIPAGSESMIKTLKTPGLRYRRFKMNMKILEAIQTTALHYERGANRTVENIHSVYSLPRGIGSETRYARAKREQYHYARGKREKSQSEGLKKNKELEIQRSGNDLPAGPSQTTSSFSPKEFHPTNQRVMLGTHVFADKQVPRDSYLMWNLQKTYQSEVDDHTNGRSNGDGDRSGDGDTIADADASKGSGNRNTSVAAPDADSDSVDKEKFLLSHNQRIGYLFAMMFDVNTQNVVDVLLDRVLSGLNWEKVFGRILNGDTGKSSGDASGNSDNADAKTNHHQNPNFPNYLKPHSKPYVITNGYATYNTYNTAESAEYISQKERDTHYCETLYRQLTHWYNEKTLWKVTQFRMDLLLRTKEKIRLKLQEQVQKEIQKGDEELQKIKREKKEEEDLWQLWEDEVKSLRMRRLAKALETGGMEAKNALEKVFDDREAQLKKDVLSERAVQLKGLRERELKRVSELKNSSQVRKKVSQKLDLFMDKFKKVYVKGVGRAFVDVDTRLDYLVSPGNKKRCANTLKKMKSMIEFTDVEVEMGVGTVDESATVGESESGDEEFNFPGNDNDNVGPGEQHVVLYEDLGGGYRNPSADESENPTDANASDAPNAHTVFVVIKGRRKTVSAGKKGADNHAKLDPNSPDTNNHAPILFEVHVRVGRARIVGEQLRKHYTNKLQHHSLLEDVLLFLDMKQRVGQLREQIESPSGSYAAVGYSVYDEISKTYRKEIEKNDNVNDNQNQNDNQDQEVVTVSQDSEVPSVLHSPNAYRNLRRGRLFYFHDGVRRRRSGKRPPRVSTTDRDSNNLENLVHLKYVPWRTNSSHTQSSIDDKTDDTPPAFRILENESEIYLRKSLTLHARALLKQFPDFEEVLREERAEQNSQNFKAEIERANDDGDDSKANNITKGSNGLSTKVNHSKLTATVGKEADLDLSEKEADVNANGSFSEVSELSDFTKSADAWDLNRNQILWDPFLESSEDYRYNFRRDAGDVD
jgi:hypothetical protein